ncbi:MAG: hypothetical protein IKO76_05050 [Butyrivibrio sp.]|nr:hypothetical protein [Butyrivibrio sp.]
MQSKSANTEGGIITENLRLQLEEQRNQLNEYIKQVEKRLKRSANIEKCAVCTATRKNGFQYYLMEGNKRTYVKTKDLDAVRKIVQKSYDESVYKKLLTMRYQIERFLKLYDSDAISGIYRDLGDAKKPLVNPLIPTDEQYLQEWYETHPACQNLFPMQGSYLTSRGEEVRSKSEKIIADLFDKYNVPYQYEPEIKLSDGHILYPDFVLLNMRQRKTIYWEHFGLISDEEYAKKTCLKMNLYEENGFIIGENMLFSMESDDIPLNIKQIESKIKKHLL